MAKRNSEGVYQKICNAASPFRSTMRRISHLPQGSITVTSDHKQLSQKSKSPVRISSHQTIPVHALHQSKMIPIEFDHQAAHFPAFLLAGKENNTGKLVQDSSDSEIQVVKSHKFAKSVSRKQETAQPEKPKPVLVNEEDAPSEYKQPKHVTSGLAKFKENDDLEHEIICNDYIDKVKMRLMRAASQAGGP